MKTDELIQLLAADAPVRQRLGRMLTTALLAGAVLSATLMVTTVGIRHNMLTVFETARVFFKIFETLLLAALAANLVFRIGKPGVSLKASLVAFAAPFALLLVALGAELIAVPQDEWASSWIGVHSGFCLFFIPVLSIAPFAGFMLALKQGAPANPGFAGAVAGFAASTMAAAIYAWHCPDDSPLFVASWYGLSIVLVSLVGLLVGRRLLRW